MKCHLIILFVFVLAFSNLFGQTYDCDLLKKAIESEHFKKEFFLCKSEQIIQLYDKKESFNNCSSFELCGNTILITHDTLYRDLSPEKYGNDKYPEVVVLYDITNKKNIYSLSFWRPYSGANVKLTFKKKKEKIKLIDYEIGTF